MRKTLALGVLAAALLMVPTVVMAATGSFSSPSSTTALTVSNSGTGRAISATSKSNYAGRFARTATTGTTASVYASTASGSAGAPAIYGHATNTGPISTYGVLGRSDAAGGRGVYGFATKTTGSNFGVWGKTASSDINAAGVYGTATASSGSPVGVWGNSNAATGAGMYGFGHYGVFGDSSGVGNGTYGLITSTDTGLGGHLHAAPPVTNGEVGNIAGTCTIASGQTSATCTFDNAFKSGVVPVVVLTPTSNINGIGGNAFWVDTVSGTAFTAHLATALSPGAAVTFNFIAIGIDSGIPQ